MITQQDSEDVHRRELPPAVAVVLVNWRRPDMTIAAVQKLRRQTVSPRIIVVDNGSGDDSCERIAAALPDVVLIARNDNGGFGAGCNSGIRAALDAGCRFVWLLNNDAEPRDDALERLLDRALADERIGLVGSAIIEDAEVGAAHSGSILDSSLLKTRLSLDEGELNGARYAWLTAASLLLSARLIEQIGGFDEEFFMYWEDADLSMRARRAGFKLAVAPDAVISHQPGTSSVGAERLRHGWHLKSQLRWIDKHAASPRTSRAIIKGKYLLKALIDGDLQRFRALLPLAVRG